jgi:hypothetical protein
LALDEKKEERESRKEERESNSFNHKNAEFDYKMKLVQRYQEMKEEYGSDDEESIKFFPHMKPVVDAKYSHANARD